MNETVVLSTGASEYFARRIVEQVPGTTFVGTARKTFRGGERYFRIRIDEEMDLFGVNVIIAASITSDAELDEVERVGTAAAGYGARRVIYVVPFLGYATMDRAKNPGEIVTAKIVARRLSQIPHGDLRNAFLFLDLHTEGLIHYFEKDVLRKPVSATHLLIEEMEKLGITNEDGDLCIGSGDLGRTTLVENIAAHFGASMAFISKTREFEETEIYAVIGDVAGKKVCLVDDMLRSCGTTVKGCNAYLKNGAKKVFAASTHPAFDDKEAIKYLLASPIEKVIVTNSHWRCLSPWVVNPDKMVVVDASPLFVPPIKRLLSA